MIRYIICYDCDGRGYTQNGRCATCDGKGELKWIIEEKKEDEKEIKKED